MGNFEQIIKKRKRTSMYAVNEKPQHCPSCKSVESRVKGTRKFNYPERTIRNRICTECAQGFSTIEVGML